MAIIVVPHNKYLPLIKLCAENSIHILKEKPFAISLSEAKNIKLIADKHDIKIMTCFQIEQKNRFSNLQFDFPNAHTFHKELIKFPTWYGKDRKEFAKYYIKALEQAIYKFKK